MDLRFLPPDESFGSIWFEWRQEPQAKAHNPIDECTELELTARLWHQKSNLRNLENNEPHRWFVTLDDQCVATVALEQVNIHHKSASFGYHIGQSHSGRGIASEVVKQFMSKVFHESELNRIIATVHTENAASQRVLIKNGFVKEGRLREYVIIDGEAADFDLYSLLRSDHQAR
jgi:RimJ/RimL family protein N-acetyltransferase